MAGWDFTYTVGFQADMKNVVERIKAFSGSLKDTPFVMSAELPGLDTGAAQKIFNEFAKKAQDITGVTAKVETMVSATGKKIKEITGLTITYTNAAGNAAVATLKIPNNMKDLPKRISEFDAMGKKAADWSARAEKMGEKEKIAIQGSSKALTDKINQYKEAAAKGDFGLANSLIPQIRKLNEEFNKQVSLSKLAANAVRSWAANIVNAVKQTVSYTISIGAMRAAQQLLNEAVQFTIQLNKEMINIQVLQAEGAQTPEEIRALALSYNQLAQQLGVTTVEVAKGSVEWLRQGKTIQETTELLKASTMLSKLGNLSAAEATEYLTSAINGYGMAAEEATSIVDKLVAVDNVAATSTRELATALRYVSAVAAESGVTFEQLVSYIGTISQTTRQNAEMIGQALKTIFTRMQDIRAGKIDEDGLGINNAAIALERVGVQLMESETEFRDFGTVLEELAGKWDTLNEVEQANIAKAIAGVRQQNMFRVLMQNMNEAIRLQGVQYAATGLAADRYNIYLQGVEASQNKLKASAEQLFLSLKGFDNIIITVNTVASGFLKLINAIGGLPTVIITATTALAVYTIVTKKAADGSLYFGDIALARLIKNIGNFVTGLWRTITAQLTVTTAFRASAGAAAAFGATIKTLLASIPIFGWIALGIGLVLEVITSTANAAEKAKIKLDELRSSLSQTASELSNLNTQKEQIVELWQSYEKLGNKVNKTAKEQAEYYKIQAQLVQLAPGIASYYDEQGNLILEEGILLSDLLELKKEEIKLTREKLQITAKESTKAEIKNIDDLINKYKILEATPRGARGGIGSGYGKLSEEDTRKALSELNLAKLSLKQSFFSMGQEGRDAFIDGLVAKGRIDLVEYLIGTPEENDLRIRGEALNKIAVEYMEKHKIPLSVYVNEDNLIDTAKSIQSKIKKYLEVKEKIKAGDILGISTEDLNDLGLTLGYTDEGILTLADGEEYLNNQIEATIEAIRNVNPVLAEKIELSYQGADAAISETDAIKQLTDSINAVASAAQEQNDNGYISVKTAMDLVSANAELANYLTLTANGYYFEADAARQAIAQEAYDMLIKYKLYDAARLAAQGNYILALSAVQTTQTIIAEKDALISLLKALAGLSVSVKIPSGGGGGGAAATEESPEKKALEAEIKAREENIERIEKEIKALEKRKDALKDQLAAFKKLIDAQKELLKREKEAADYKKESEKRAKKLADVQADLLMLSLDDSEDAHRKRLELEQQEAELKEEIQQESTEREYDLQVQALEDLEAAFTASIDAQIEQIDRLIDAFRNQIDVMREGIENLRDAMNELANAIRNARNAASGVGGRNEPVAPFIPAGSRTSRLGSGRGEDVVRGVTSTGIHYSGSRHQGGLAESHHDGEFAGNLKTNEVFAKLLKGEYVANEQQMDTFMKKTLPRIASYPTVSKINNNQLGDTYTIGDIIIKVAGDLDKKAVPNIQEAVFDALTIAIKQKGKKTNAFNYSI